MADLNNDGVPDLVTVNRYSHNVSVLLGRGDGTFEAQTTSAVGLIPFSVAVADLNSDGVPDLVTANRGNNVSVLLGRGDGTFQAQTTFGVGLYPESVAVADLNGDGVPDLATANEGSNNVSVLLGRGAPVNSGPVTGCTLAGDEGYAGWFLGPVVATLQAKTPDGEIERVEYRFGQEETWEVYDQPLATDQEGVTTLHYRAIDDAGRIESEKTRQIPIDTMPPTTTLEPRGKADSGGAFLGGAHVILSATDPEPGSGIRVIEYRLDDGPWQTYVSPLSISQIGTTTVDYRAVDVAGNVEELNSQIIRVRQAPPPPGGT